MLPAQPVTNAASQVWAEEALAAAHELPAEPVGPLHGVPVLVKELFDVAGHETTGCCEAFRGRIASADAFLVARLRDAGAIIVGKTNQHELAASGTKAGSGIRIVKSPRRIGERPGGPGPFHLAGSGLLS